MGEEIFLSPHPLEREFIRLLTDFGFKRVFGSRKRVGILKRFLNALFEGEMRITNVEFRDKEILPEHEGGKKVLYDIYCTTDKGHHFIIEMQQEESENFADRMLFYGCKAVVNQGIKGVEYELYPVYCVILTDFNMEGKKGETAQGYTPDGKTFSRDIHRKPSVYISGLTGSSQRMG
ncbi:MAG: Rpn family recombination-promoting nuclease/putative transposase [Bacteroidales bacterium]|nr:Rpn family recombination-promoting nuclease/putative transposase [Bacteroidales bacterium]